MGRNTLVVGVDYGTDSVRAVVVDAREGRELGQAVHKYKRWSEGRYCDPAANQYRQHPLDYLEGLVSSVKKALKKCPEGTANKVVGLAVDTTGSTPVAVDMMGLPLALLPEFDNDPDAMFILWKDHTGVAEAEEINHLARTWGGDDFTRFEGGIYSSEWFWSKILHAVRRSPKVKAAAFSWLEHCDWIPALLTGTANPLAVKRSRCAAGHKAMWHAAFGGLPSGDFLSRLDPSFPELRNHLFTDTFTSDVSAGKLTKVWAEKLGLTENVEVGVGAFDAHMGAVGGEIRPYILSKVIGTSTCDMVIAPAAEVGDKLIRGICGQVDGSIVPGMIGMEAGQSAFGDVYAWFRDLLLWPARNLGKGKDNMADKLVAELGKRAEKTRPSASAPLALDWLNGRRTPDADQLLKGGIVGLTLGTDAVAIFRALVESTAYGARRIAERFVEEGVPIKGVIALGGIPKKSPFVMQTIADVMNMPVEVCASEQAVALGAAMFASVVGGVHKKVEDAQKAMGAGFEKTYTPIPANAEVYEKSYKRYLELGAFVEKSLSGD